MKKLLIICSTLLLVNCTTTKVKTVDNMASHDNKLFMTVNEATYHFDLWSGKKLIESDRKVVQCSRKTPKKFECSSVDFLIDGSPMYEQTDHMSN